ncbi:hypothetical protein [Burkholderia gladioli]|uniref:hypothetical protein n=1 Tax=Burkholderia gladioli TaxID=28095 RepID=UPI00163EDB75|nr:hypothetical protein [Burkholderia gladioli]
MDTAIEIPKMTNLDVAFGTVEGLPSYASIPDEFKRHGGTKWNELFSKWFFGGLNSLSVTPKPGVDKDAALAHVRALMASFEPKHEHKEAGVAFLMSRYFDDASWS